MKKTIVLFLAIALVLSGCFYTQDDLDQAKLSGYESGYDSGYDNGYSKGYADGYDQGYGEGLYALVPVSVPMSGTILSGSESYGSEITVHAESGNSCVVSLRDINGNERVSFFVRAGESATIGVPSEYLYAYFASGETWYGYGEGLMFGENTAYSKDDEALDFTEYTYEYTLYPVNNGNFSETPSDENEFFG